MYFITICTQNREEILGKIENNDPPSKITVAQIIGLYKSGVSRNTNQKYNITIWQRNYYERIIRSENEYLKICQYIKNNPAKYRGENERDD